MPCLLNIASFLILSDLIVSEPFLEIAYCTPSSRLKAILLIHIYIYKQHEKNWPDDQNKRRIMNEINDKKYYVTQKNFNKIKRRIFRKKWKNEKC